MRFEDFARAHGLIINTLTPHKWVSTPTEDHPHKRNGRYKFIGDVGWVQNWATMQAPVMWKSDKPVSVDWRKQAQKADRERQEAAKKASAKAGWILHQCKTEHHPYLEAKGFEKEVGNVWTTDNGERLLVVPMRINGNLVGAQLISDKGVKKFLQGQTTKGAAFVMDAKGIPIFCEGYATALSIRAAMKAVKLRYTIYVCFSAGNIKEVAGRVGGGIVVADHDPNGVGENAALSTGKPYWISPTVGDDFNDHHKRVGIFQAATSLKNLILQHNTPSSHARTSLQSA